jgi:hypothetical protein
LLWIGFFSAAALPAPARAEPAAPRTAQMATVFAEGEDEFSDKWGVRKLMRSLTTRTRIIQLAIVILCLTLYIMMRK